MKTKSILSIAAAVLCLCSCASQKEFVILHVNDTHSHHEPMRSEPRAGRCGVIERGAIVDSVMASRGKDNVLLLHAGDFNQGTSYYTVLGGSLEVNEVNAFGYDCITLGNHEFDNGIEDLAARLSRIKCPVVCANVDFSGTALEEVTRPYAIVEKAGKKIGIIGVTSDLSSNVAYAISSRLRQLDNATVINQWADYLHNVEKCDMIILLSHLGYREDNEIVPYTKWLDMVIGGHSHTFVDDFVYVKDASGKKVPIITDGCWGFAVGEVTVRL